MFDFGQAFSMFMQNAKQQHPDVNPASMAQNMMGQNFQSPQQALDYMLQTGRINQAIHNEAKKWI